MRVHLDLPPELLPSDYGLVKIDLKGLSVETVDIMPDDPRTFGDGWLRERRTAVLQVPSAIVPENPNLLLNPAHPLAAKAGFVSTRRFEFDQRLWLPL